MLRLRYGDGTLELPRPSGRLVRIIEAEAPVPNEAPPSIFSKALSRPLGSPPLREIARGKKTAAILIPGKARRTGTEYYVPALLDELNAAGVEDSGITVFLADGTHAQHVEADIADLLGPEARARVQCVGHDCKDASQLVRVGTTSRGTPVEFNRQVMSADIRILTGRIVPHYFAGYSGGRKALLPGVAGWDTILAYHKLTLAPEKGIHPRSAICQLEENPVHLDMVEAVDFVQAEFCLNTLLDADHRIIAAFTGSPRAVHKQGCQTADEMFRIRIPEPVDAVITCAGGLPYDCNFMQALKAPFNVKEILRPGGAMLWIGECAGGMLPGFLEWAKIKSYDELNALARSQYNLTSHNSIMMRNLTTNANVGMISELPEEEVEAMGIHPLQDADTAIEWLSRNSPPDFTYAVIPNANALCVALEPSNQTH